MESIDIVSAAVGIMVALVSTSVYGLMATWLRRRVSIRSPESQAIAQLVPAVNALLESKPSEHQALIAILEAQKGICNGNVDLALDTARAASEKFDSFLLGAARVRM